jgi:hypothetical protein
MQNKFLIKRIMNNTVVKEGLRFAAWTAASVLGGVIAVRFNEAFTMTSVKIKKEKIASWLAKDSNKELFVGLGAMPVSGWEDEKDEKKLNEYLSCIKIINNNRFYLQSVIRRKKAEETTDEKPAE